MRFRYARHTNNIDALIQFYTNIIGLKVLGDFQDHDGYQGVFLGLEGQDWHLEFTSSDEKAIHQADEDDLLVFYLSSNEELNAVQQSAIRNDVPSRISKNPYWRKNGLEWLDPDDFGVICTVRPFPLQKNLINPLLQEAGIRTWGELLSYVRDLPYGRNENRQDLDLVIREKKGTCSSKHAYLKHVANEHQIPQVKLHLVIYKMTESNTPGIGDVLTQNQLEYIPEAHCYLEINGIAIDVTNPNSSIERIKPDFMESVVIDAHQVNQYKVDYHKNYIDKWLTTENLSFSSDEIWQIREQCIQALSD